MRTMHLILKSNLMIYLTTPILGGPLKTIKTILKRKMEPTRVGDSSLVKNLNYMTNS